MKDQSKTKQVLIQELVSLRQRTAELERLESERKRAEEKLQESEERFRLLLQRSSDMIAIVDANGVERYVSESVEKVTGFSSQEIIAESGFKFLHPDDVPVMAGALQQLLAHPEKQVRREYRHHHKDGRWLHMEAIGTNYLNDPRIEGILMNIREITDRKKIEEALRESEENFHSSFDDAPLGIRIVTMEGETIYANRAILDIYGYDSIEELRTTPVKQRYTPESYAQFQTRMEERQRGDVVPSEYEISIVRKSGEVRHLQVFRKKALWNGKMQFQVIYHDITDGKKMEEMLRESEEKYRYLVTYAPAAIYELDLASRRFISVNDVMCQLSGYTREEFLSLNPMQLLAEESRNVFMQRLAKAFSGEQVPDAVEYRIRGKNRREFCVLLNTKYSYGPENRITATVVAHDITERKRLEEELILSEKKNRNLVDNTLVGVYQTNPEGKILYVNQAFANMFGYDSPEELMSINAISLYKNKQDRQKLIEAIKKDRKLLNYDLELVTKDGEDKNIILSGVLDGDSILGTLVDITERKKAETTLQAAEELYRTLADSSQIAIYIVQDKKLVFANPHLSQYSGYAQEELIGKDISTFVYPDDSEIVQKKAKQMLKGETSIPYEYRIIDKNGQIRWLVETVSPITYHGKRATLGSTMDITEQKRIEKKLEEAKDILIQSEKLAAIGRLSSGAAHEIRNPLNIMSLNLQMLEIKGTLDDETKKAVDVCHTQIDRIVKIIEGLQKFSRISEKKLSPENVTEVIDHVLSLSAPRIKTENVTTDVRCDPDLPQIFMDRAAMEQVFFNLISNALDAIKDEGKKDLRISAERKGGNILVTVSDTGHGIKEEDFQKLFDPFFTTKGPDKGTGLGLSISYGILQNHKGKIWAQNNETGGTSFFIELPIEKRAMA